MLFKKYDSFPKTKHFIYFRYSKCCYLVIIRFHLTDLKGKKTCLKLFRFTKKLRCSSRELQLNSLPKKLSAEFGGKSHTTVFHAYEKINQAIKKGSPTETRYREIKNKTKLNAYS